MQPNDRYGQESFLNQDEHSIEAENLDRLRLLRQLLSPHEQKVPEYHDPQIIREELKKAANKDIKLLGILSKENHSIEEKEYLFLQSIKTSLLLEVEWRQKGIRVATTAIDITPMWQDSLSAYERITYEFVDKGSLTQEEAIEKIQKYKQQLEQENGRKTMELLTELERTQLQKEKKRLRLVASKIHTINSEIWNPEIVTSIATCVLDLTNSTENEYRFEQILTVESYPWWHTFIQLAHKYAPGFVRSWNHKKEIIFDLEVKEQLTKQTSLIPKLFSSMAVEKNAASIGSKRLKDLIESTFNPTQHRNKMFKLRKDYLRSIHRTRSELQQKLIDAQINMDTSRVNEFKKAIQEFDKQHPNTLFSAQHELQRAIQLAHASYLHKRRTTQGPLTETKQFVMLCSSLAENGLEVPKKMKSILETIQLVSTGTVEQHDARKKLKLYNSIRLFTLLLPIMSELYSDAFPQISQNIGKSATDGKLDLTEMGIQWLTESKNAEEVLNTTEQILLYSMRFIPPDIATDIALQAQVFFSDPSIENASTIMRYLAEQIFTQDIHHFHRHASLSQYPEDRREALAQLETIKNPDYQTGEQLLLGAFSIYEQHMSEKGLSTEIFWQNHPLKIELQDALSTLFSPKEKDETETKKSDLYNFALKNHELNKIHQFSANPFNTYAEVTELYDAIHASQFESDQYQVMAYYSDFFGFLLDKYYQSQQPVSIQELIAFALEKNSGNLHYALWDVSIFMKLLTRSSYATGETNRYDSYSGILAINLLQDPFSNGYRASDVAQILPETTFWNMPNEIFPKNYDPANLAGIYHYLNLLALRGEYPDSSGIAGLLIEWHTSAGKETEYGMKRLEDQLQWLMLNSSSISQIIHNLPEKEFVDESLLTTETLRDATKPHDQVIFFIEPIQKELQNQLDDAAFNALLQGRIISIRLHDGTSRYMSLGGSIVLPYLHISENPDIVKDFLRPPTSTPFIIEESLPKFSSFQVTVESTEKTIGLKDDYTKQELMLIILSKPDPNYLLQIADRVSIEVVQETIEELLANNGLPYVLGFPDLFHTYVTEKMFIENLASGTWDFQYSFSQILEDGWDKYWDVSTLVFYAKKQMTSSWGTYIIFAPELFKDTVQKEELGSLIDTAGIDYFLSYYPEGWNSIWSVSEVQEYVKEHYADTYNELALFFPEILTPSAP